MFNRKTGSTTLVTLIHKVSRKYGLQMKMEATIHSSKENCGFMTFYHVNGLNYDSREDKVSRPRVLLPSRTNIVKCKDKSLGFSPTVIDTVFLSIVRDPVNNFPSAYNFFEISKALNQGKHISIDEFLSKPDFFRRQLAYRSMLWSVTQNGQLFHFGLDHEYHDNEEIVTKYLDYLERELGFVLVTEYYDESLILLKKLLCWDMEDILYVARRVSHRDSSPNPSTRDKINRWNYADLKLYQRFNRTLWRKVREYGEEFERELGIFQQLKKAVTEDCDTLNYLREDTLIFLRNIGTFIQDGRQYCQHLTSWFSTETTILVENRRLADYKVSPTNDGKAYGGSKEESNDLESNGVQCVHVHYYKYSDTWSSWFGRSVFALDVYLKVGNNTDVLQPNIVKQNDELVAKLEINTTQHDIQITTEAKYSKDDIIISSVGLQRGHC
ncbi:galactosylceramide sulfotransferase-like isoform X2 [Glandiceps talaboti]